jgi:hypothetical protein
MPLGNRRSQVEVATKVAFVLKTDNLALEDLGASVWTRCQFAPLTAATKRRVGNIGERGMLGRI